MLAQDGNDNQKLVGKHFAYLRSQRLSFTQRHLAKELTEHNIIEYISPTRISDAERGKINLTKEYSTIFIKYLQEKYPMLYEYIDNDKELSEAIVNLPSHHLVHKNNVPGNSSHEPKSPPIGKVGRQNHEQLKLKLGEIEITLVDGMLKITDSRGYSISTNRVSLKITL